MKNGFVRAVEPSFLHISFPLPARSPGNGVISWLASHGRRFGGGKEEHTNGESNARSWARTSLLPVKSSSSFHLPRFHDPSRIPKSLS
jgi:hypothetical protein